jgi:hypothetical protein
MKATIVLAVLAGLATVVASPAADMADCRAYANRGSAAALRQLLGMPFIDVSAGRFLYRRAYTYCLNSDEVPPMTFTAEEQPIIDDAIPLPKAKPPGSVPAIDPQEEQAGGNLPLAPSKVRVKAAAKGEALCIRHGKKTVYHGRSWRCVS